MTARELATFLSYIIVGLFIVALLLFVLAVQQLRRGRKGPYWRLRRRASQRGGILFLASLALFVIAGALTFYSGLAAVAYKGLDDLFRRPGGGLVGVILPSETPTPNASLSATPTLTLSPSPAPSATAAAQPDGDADSQP